MNKLINGLHHITALASDAQKNLDFYAGILGLRMVKKTINFDAPEVYHLYYGNEKGSPGTIMTFFPYEGMPRGRKGKGQVTVTSFSLPAHSMEYWSKRLDQFNIPHLQPEERFEEWFIYLEDSDGLGLELVFTDKDERSGFTYGNIPIEMSIKGFYGITLMEEGHQTTAELLTHFLDHEEVGSIGNRFRYSTTNNPGDFIDILCSPDSLKGSGGAGTIHHVAFATASEATQLAARERLIKKGLNVTPVLDRQYFHSVYFREPGGVLFEIATLPPGFTVDEELSHLGEHLKLPAWQEANRAWIESELPLIELNLKQFKDK